MQVQHYASDPTVTAVLQWRSDSATLAMLRPVLARLREIPDEPCRMGEVPYSCSREHENRLCVPCAHRDVRAALFEGET